MASEHVKPHNQPLTESEAQWADLDDRQITKRQLIELSEEIYYIVRKQLERRLANGEAVEPLERPPPS